MIEAFAVKIMSDIEALDPSYAEKAKERLVLIMRSIAFDGRESLKENKRESCNSCRKRRWNSIFIIGYRGHDRTFSLFIRPGGL